MLHDSLGMLPAYPYVLPQPLVNRYSDEDAIIRGTLFPELDLPFHNFHIAQPLPKTPLTELMMLDFVCLELRLYLDTHPDDASAAEIFEEYRRKSADAKKALRDTQENQQFNSWVFSPWPWEGEV
jgi:spore coat protein JB